MGQSDGAVNKGGVRRRRFTNLNLRLTFQENYDLTETILGSGTYGEVRICKNKPENEREEGKEFAVKIVRKSSLYFSRVRVLREIETFYICREHENIIQFLHFFEEPSGFFLVFEKIEGGPLFDHILKRNYLNESEASQIVLELAKALSFLHHKGIAHRDLKAENVLCVLVDSPCPVKLGDFDLCSEVTNSTTPKLLTPVGSLEYMAPEVLETFSPTEEMNEEEEEEWRRTDEFPWPTYDKKCDLWSLGVLAYVLLCGYPPFSGSCQRETCGWDEGEACYDCQRNLKSSIRKGIVDFSDTTWRKVSTNAIDLVSKLLMKDPAKRLSAQDLLIHPWIIGQGSNNPLKTPSMLRRNSSLKDLTTFTSSANTLRRAISAYNRSSPNEFGKLLSRQKKNPFMFSSIDEDGSS